jgi:hypothetical protein
MKENAKILASRLATRRTRNVDRKSVQVSLAKQCFALVHDKIRFRGFFCGLVHTPLELYDTIAIYADHLQVWNEEMWNFMAQERKVEAISVQF